MSEQQGKPRPTLEERMKRLSAISPRAAEFYESLVRVKGQDYADLVSCYAMAGTCIQETADEAFPVGLMISTRFVAVVGSFVGLAVEWHNKMHGTKFTAKDLDMDGHALSDFLDEDIADKANADKTKKG